MAIYIALLRGINVGGKNKIKMLDLKKMLEQLELHQVQTYIQSGNVLFASEETDVAALRQRIEDGINHHFEISTPVILRTAAEWKAILRECPYQPSTSEEGKRVQITLLVNPAESKVHEILSSGASEEDEFIVSGREIYFLFRQPVNASRLADNVQKLGKEVTSRNWNTIKKLDVLIDAMQA